MSYLFNSTPQTLGETTERASIWPTHGKPTQPPTTSQSKDPNSAAGLLFFPLTPPYLDGEPFKMTTMRTRRGTMEEKKKTTASTQPGRAKAPGLRGY